MSYLSEETDKWQTDRPIHSTGV